MRETGRVKSFMDDRGYGFITNDEDGADLYVHIKQILQAGLSTLEEGQRVSYIIVNGRKRIEAHDIQIIEY